MSWRASSLPMFALLAAAACSSNTPVGPAEVGNPSFQVIAPPAGPDPLGERIVVCKVGGEGSYDFTWSGTDFSPPPATPIGGAFSLQPGECWDLGFFGGAGANVSVTETPRDGHEVVSIVVDQLNGPDQNLSGTNTVSNVIGSGTPQQSAVVTFTNRVLPPPPPPGDEGCTPGYWKNHLDSWVTYAPNQSAGSVFTIPGSLSSLAGVSLKNTLNGGGGPGALGGAKILLRAATAALLNAESSVAYPRSTSDILTDVNAALASGERSVMLALAAEIDADNNLGCPLN